jgi:hypothetical protein
VGERVAVLVELFQKRLVNALVRATCENPLRAFAARSG